MNARRDRSRRRQIRDTLRVKAPAVFLCGLAGAVAVIALGLAAHASGLGGTGVLILLGSLVTRSLGPETAAAGLVVLVIALGASAFGYAIVFWSAHRSGAGVGINLAIFHWLLMGLAAGMAPLIHPLVPRLLPAPGFFFLRLGGARALLFLTGHLVYGAIVGSLFDHLSIRRELPRPITDSLPDDQTEWSLSQRTSGSMS